jgi:hypothetical protein
VTIARLDIAGQPENKPSLQHVLKMAPWEVILILKKELARLRLERGALIIWVLFADRFILC